MSIHRSLVTCLATILLFGAATTEVYAVPNLINYQGHVEVDGVPYSGSGQFKFALVNAAGDTTYWSNDDSSSAGAEPTAAVTLTVAEGVFSVLLGDVGMTAIPASVFADHDDISLRLWFDDGINGSQRLSPDRRIAAVGFAVVAGSVPEEAITTAMIADGSVTTAKLAAGFATPWTISGSDLSFSSGDVGFNNLNLPSSTATAGIIRSGADTLLHTFGEKNMFSGIKAGNLTMTGGFNTAVGENSLFKNETGIANTAIGEDSLRDNTFGDSNTAVGQATLRVNDTGKANTAVGQASMALNTIGNYNTAVGEDSLKANTEGSFNTVMGQDAMVANTTGSYNTALGEDSLKANINGELNTAVGADTLASNTSGASNVAIGEDALHDNTTANQNTGVGVDSLRNNSTGAGNIALGFAAGQNLTTGDHNINIGNIGVAAESATIRIGDSDQTRAFLAGVRAVTTGESDELPVVVDSNGQLGTISNGIITRDMLSLELRSALNLVALGFMEFVPVGNPGNAADPEDGDGVVSGVQNLGSVSKTFLIGKNEVTNAQYVEFLNAVAKQDSKGLYHVTMGSGTRGGIIRSGSSPNLAYAFKPNMHNKPVNYVSFLDACRFCNWLHNERPSGLQDAFTTEDGAYDLTDSAAITNNTLARKAGARFFLPSENEWYKAAFHQPSSEGGDADNYWGYTTQSNSVAAIATADVQGSISNQSAHVENWGFGADWNGQNGNVTTVGSGGVGSASFYGAFDMGGNVFEWTDTIIIDASRNGRRFRGGDWRGGDNGLKNDYWSWGTLTLQQDNGGFRVGAK